MLGLFFFTWGVASVVAEFTVAAFENIELNRIITCGFWYYLIFLIVAVFGLGAFLKVLMKYKNRQRGEIMPELYYRLY